VRLRDQGLVLCPGLPWHNIRGLGNRSGISMIAFDAETIWHTVVHDLPPLKAAGCSDGQPLGCQGRGRLTIGRRFTNLPHRMRR
jgi:hypothetical protein